VGAPIGRKRERLTLGRRSGKREYKGRKRSGRKREREERGEEGRLQGLR